MRRTHGMRSTLGTRRVRRMVDAGRKWTEVLAVSRIGRGHRKGQERPAVKGTVECHDRRTIRKGAGDLDRVFRRLRSRRQEHRLAPGRCRVAGEGAQPFAQFHVSAVGGHLETGVHQPIELTADGLEDARVPMTCVQRADAAGEVEVFTAFIVPDATAFRARDGNRVRHGNTARNRSFASGGPRVGRRSDRHFSGSCNQFAARQFANRRGRASGWSGLKTRRHVQAGAGLKTRPPKPGDSGSASRSERRRRLRRFARTDQALVRVRDLQAARVRSTVSRAIPSRQEGRPW